MTAHLAFVVAALAACSSPPPPVTPATPADPTGPVAPTPGAVSVTGFAPDRGETSGGTTVVFQGNDLEDRKIKVYFGNRPARVLSVSPSEFAVEAPGGKPGEAVSIMVIVQGAGEFPMAQAFRFADVPSATPLVRSGTQAQIAAKLNQEGEALLAQGDYAGASAKFREAAARVPEARFFGNLCLSLTAEHKHAEARAACDAYAKLSP